MEKRTGTLIQLGACSSCNAGCTNANGQRANMPITELTIGILKLRLCDDCKKRLASLCA